MELSRFEKFEEIRTQIKNEGSLSHEQKQFFVQLEKVKNDLLEIDEEYFREVVEDFCREFDAEHIVFEKQNDTKFYSEELHEQLINVLQELQKTSFETSKYQNSEQNFNEYIVDALKTTNWLHIFSFEKYKNFLKKIDVEQQNYLSNLKQLQLEGDSLYKEFKDHNLLSNEQIASQTTGDLSLMVKNITENGDNKCAQIMHSIKKMRFSQKWLFLTLMFLIVVEIVIVLLAVFL